MKRETALMQQDISESSVHKKHKPMRVLLIVAEDALRECILHCLRQEGFRIEVAFTGEQVLSQAQTLLPDLFLLGEKLPDLSGLDLCRQLRSNPLTSHLPILIVSEKDDIRDRILGLEAGADDYLTWQSLETDEFVKRIRVALREVANIIHHEVKIVD